MRRTGRMIAAAVLAGLTLAACAGVTRYDAAGDVHAFLTAIRDGDQAGFDAHVDRPALKQQLEARLEAAAERRGGDWAAATMVLARPLIDAAADQLIQPGVFLAVAELLGYSPDKPLPSRVVIASALRPLDDDHVCVPRKKDGPCLMVFRNEGGVWRLTDFQGDTSLLHPPGR